MFVLLIEDERELRDLVRYGLESAGMRVATATDGEHALRLLDDLRPDVIVTDMTMPILDGLGFLQFYRRRADQPAPVIAVSALQTCLARALVGGAAAVLPKPYSIAALVEVIHRITTQRRDQPVQMLFG
jgi:two-component system chemotaxis response regulator CheY